MLNKALDAFHAFTYEEGITGRGFMWFENCSDNLVTGRPQAEAAQIKNFQMSASMVEMPKIIGPQCISLSLKLMMS